MRSKKEKINKYKILSKNKNMKKLKNRELERISIEEYKTATKTPITLILEDVRSALNVGSAFRTADAFRIEKVILCGITAQPPHRDIQRTALGATDSVEWQHISTIEAAIQSLKEQNYHIIAIEQANPKTLLNDFKTEDSQKYALIFGNEVKGISEKAMNLIDTCIEIPQIGTKHSLNISVSIGVVLWDFFVKIQAD